MAERAGPVEADIHADHEIGGEADEPGIDIIARRARLSGKRLAHRPEPASGAAQHRAFQHGHHLIDALRVRNPFARVRRVRHFRPQLLERIAVRADPAFMAEDG